MTQWLDTILKSLDCLMLQRVSQTEIETFRSAAADRLPEGSERLPCK